MKNSRKPRIKQLSTFSVGQDQSEKGCRPPVRPTGRNEALKPSTAELECLVAAQKLAGNIVRRARYENHDLRKFSFLAFESMRNLIRILRDQPSAEESLHVGEVRP